MFPTATVPRFRSDTLTVRDVEGSCRISIPRNDKHDDCYGIAQILALPSQYIVWAPDRSGSGGSGRPLI